MTLAALLLAVPLALSAVPAPAPDTSSAAIAAWADSIAGHGTTLVRTRRLVHWINDHFTWSYTDYQQRTPEQIVARRAGNCAELASVLRLVLDDLHVRSRWVHEINVQPEQTPARQATAEAKVKEYGDGMSVFGLQHNDHIWLEVADESGNWFPADAAYGVVGLEEWLPARLALTNRPKPRVAAVEPIAADMRAPFVMMAGEQRRGPFTEDRTDFYVIEGFAKLYRNRVTTLPGWSRWTAAVRDVSPHAQGALAGRENLHESTAKVAEVAAAYEELAREAAERHLAFVTPKR